MVEWKLSGLMSMWTRSSVKAARGRSTTPSENRGGETEDNQTSTWKLAPQRVRRGRRVRSKFSTGRTFTTVTLTHRDGIEFRVTVAGHESNSKMAQISSPKADMGCGVMTEEGSRPDEVLDIEFLHEIGSRM